MKSIIEPKILSVTGTLVCHIAFLKKSHHEWEGDMQINI